jgi:hypothetical protein
MFSQKLKGLLRAGFELAWNQFGVTTCLSQTELYKHKVLLGLCF